MIITVFITLLLVLTLYYAIFLVNVQMGLRKLKVQQSSKVQLPFVSVIVSARNEEHTIEECIRRIFNQQYPPELYELIVVSDCSIDQTDAIVARMTKTYKHLRTLTVQGNGGHGAVGKPAAISAGVKASKGEIILTTDADCSVPPTWVPTMVQYMSPDVAFAAGLVRERSNGTFLSDLSHLEFLGLITTAAGLIGVQRPIICNGANLAFKKPAFLAAQGYGKHDQWCDDETLMHRIRERRLGDIVFVPTSDAGVETSSVQSLASFWKQRLRWSAKGNHYESTSILLSVVGLYLFFLFLLLAFVGSIFYAQLRIWFVVSFVVKLLIDFSTLVRGANLFHDSFSRFLFIVAEALHAPYVVVTAGFGQFLNFEWKGRTIRR